MAKKANKKVSKKKAQKKSSSKKKVSKKKSSSKKVSKKKVSKAPAKKKTNKKVSKKKAVKKSKVIIPPPEKTPIQDPNQPGVNIPEEKLAALASHFKGPALGTEASEDEELLSDEEE